MFADLVRAHRQRLGLSQEELAGKAGLSVRSIRNLEAGRTGSPRPVTVRLLADAFGLAGAERDAFLNTAGRRAAASALDTLPDQQHVPAQLPADVAGFTGRTEQLARLDKLLAKAADPPTAVVISAITGTAGVGKTALAIHAAHRLAHRFPDGQLFIDLHGFTAAMAPVEPTDALGRLLRVLGVPGHDIPVELDDRAAMWRSTVAGRRMLILLDNAATEDQIAPLLPGTPGSYVLVTSRRRLSGLDATETMSLDMLPLADALTLFVRSAGSDRLAGQPQELLTEVVELCGRLPLAIRICGARLRSHLTWQVADLLGRLRDQDERLVELADAGGSRSVTAALDVSYQQLDLEPRRMYGLLGHHPGTDIDIYAATALADRALPATRRLLDKLLDAHLLHEPAAGRYSFHDLVRAHAGAISDDSGPDFEAAMTRLADHYRRTVAAAMDAAHPYEWERRPRVPPLSPPHPDLSDPVQANVWLDRELPNLLAVARHAGDAGRPEHLWHLSTTLYRHLHTRGYYSVARSLYQQALKVARDSGHRVGEMDALICLGHVHRQLAQYSLALDHFTPALKLAQHIGDRAATLATLRGLGQIHWIQGHYDQARNEFSQELVIARLDGHRPGETDALIGLGHICWMESRYDEASDLLSQAATVARLSQNQNATVDALRALGIVCRMQGRLEDAREHYDEAKTLAHAIGYRNGEYVTSIAIAELNRFQGQHEQAADIYSQLLESARRIGNRNLEFEVLQGFGRLQSATGRSTDAVASHLQALSLVTELGQPADEARAHDGLARAYDALDQPENAGKHWQRALEILEGLGLDRTEFNEATVASIRADLGRLQRASGTPDLAEPPR